MLHKDLKMAGSLGQIKAQVNLDCLTEEDAGVYECVIWNGYETKTTTTELRVESKLMDLICIVYTFIYIKHSCLIQTLILPLFSS